MYTLFLNTFGGGGPKIFYWNTPLDLPIHASVDHKGAVQSINSTNLMVDKRLRVDTAAIRQMIERGELGSVSHCPVSRRPF